MIYFMIYIFVLIAFITIISIINSFRSNQQIIIKKRLHHLQLQADQDKGVLAQKKETKSFYQKFMKSYSDTFSKIGIDISEKEIQMLVFVSYLSSFLIFFLLNKNILISLITGLIGLYIPYLVARQMGAKRLRNFEKLFGDALQLMANTLKSGFSFNQSLQSIAEEMPSPVCDEFEIMTQELRWGLSLAESLQNLAKRVPNEYVKLFVTAVMIQNEVGGSLSNILGKIAEAINAKQRIKDELKVLTAQGQTSGFIIGLLPIVMAFILFTLNPEFILPLFTTQLGIMMVSGAIMMEIMGLLIIKKIVNID